MKGTDGNVEDVAYHRNAGHFTYITETAVLITMILKT